MGDDLTSAPSAGAISTAGAAAPAPGAAAAPPEPASLEDAVRGAMTGGGPAEGAPDGAPGAKPAGEGKETPTVPGTDGAGTEATDKAQGEEAGEADQLADLDFADLPAARKEYLKRDPEMRATWYFRADMERLGMTVPEAREYRKLFASPKSAAAALKGAVEYGSLERAFRSEAPDAHMQVLETLRQLGPGAERLVRFIARDIDVVDPRAALERDAVKIGEILGDLKPRDDFDKQALEVVWELLEQQSLKSPKTRATQDPDRQELEGFRERERARQEKERETARRSTKEAADTEIRKWIDGSLTEAKDRFHVSGAILKDIGDALFRETEKFLVGHQWFQQEYINARDKAASAEEGRAAALKVVQEYAMPYLRDLAAQRTRPYTHGALRANQRRLEHAKNVSTLAELGGTTAAAGTPVRIPEDVSIEDRARMLLTR